MHTERFEADDLRNIIVAFRDALVAHKGIMNVMNVYPVPDGDTGTNMSLTLESVVADLPAAGGTMDEVCLAISHGSLMGARGNSGVIMSQILRGLCGELRGSDKIEGPLFSTALTAAATAAYGAVGNPVEGTILTVAREGAEAAAQAGSDFMAVLTAARSGAADALERTPELLPVLADAGVVDSGGTGLLLFFDAVLHVVDGRDIPAPVMPEGASVPNICVRPDRPDAHDHTALADLRYEVMFLLDAPDDSIERFKTNWADVGDSIVVVGGDGIWNCHVHTDDIGAAIECGIDVGRPHQIRVTDLLEEVEEQEWVVQAAETALPDAEPCTTAVVAVSVGEGVGEIFRSFGVQHVVSGGQTMNPSTAQLVAAVNALQAEGVILLPNNKNIIPVAEQVGGESNKPVIVVPSKSIVGGMAALVAYDPEANLADNAAGMIDALDHLLSGEVTQSIRATAAEGFDIAEGDWLGLASGKIVAVEPDAIAAAAAVVDALANDDHEIITLVVGEDSSDAEAATLKTKIVLAHPGIDVEIHSGGQPLYPFIIGVE